MGRALRVQDKRPPEADELPDPLVELEQLGDPIELEKLYGRSAPVELEIGFGKARHLLWAAGERPDHDFIGVELALPFVRVARYRCWRKRLLNLKLLRGDARELMARLPAGSLSAVYLLFPDPWPKKRHHKRRLVTADFAKELARVLAPGAGFHAATDHAEYAEVIRETLDACPDFERQPDFALEAAFVALTNYGEKYAREGRSFERWTWLRKPTRA